ncbi:ABC transporter ATP-binding protein [Acidimicrobiia bacterium EGI L10123]|uniref:ABC transporter ATP-binding protein n=1 Tax=Salinilacustrithrix flava TaxID=2957203 RepID=UPI003D7C1D29|nr:ABC transporter ATP-binding protein [Acidimicrobiia bacterium EGI L10123]
MSDSTARQLDEASPVLAIDGLGVEFASEHGWLRVLDEVSFAVGPRETVGLVGESGSGKSVTSLSVLGLLPRRSSRVVGDIRLRGRELGGLSTAELEDVRGREIAMIFQEPMTSLNPAFTIGDQIVAVVRRHLGWTKKQARAHAIEMLGHVGIPNPRQRVSEYPHQFSGGMRQRAMIALALSCRPRLLIADEPTTALDVTIQAQILDLIREMAEENDMSVLFVTHDLGVVADICDRVVVMYAGQVVEEGTAEEVFCTPRHPYTEGLLRAMPDVEDHVRELVPIPGTVPPPWEFPAGCRFADRCSYAQDRCRQPVALTELGPRRAVRCHRFDELDLEGAS